MAAHHIDENHDHGYKFKLSEIKGSKVEKQVDGGCEIQLQLELMETTCHNIDPTQLEDCEVRDVTDWEVRANCSVSVRVRKGDARVRSYHCDTQKVLTHSEMPGVCPDCPHLVSLHDPDGIKSVKEAVQRVNKNTTNQNYFILKDVGRIVIGSLLGRNLFYAAEFALVESDCPMGSSTPPEDRRPLCPDRARHAFCHSIYFLSKGLDSVRCDYYPPMWATLRIQREREQQSGVPDPLPNGIIERGGGSMQEGVGRLRGDGPPTGGLFSLSDALFFYQAGLESIVDDTVTQRFSSEELNSWNLLTRTNQNFRYISLRLTLFWGVGVFVRYGLLLPFRVTLAAIGLSWLVIGTVLVGLLPESSVKNWLSELVHLTCYRVCARGLSATILYHNKENRPRKGGICVANHTTPIDIVILANDGCYAMVGQVHGGLMGVLQRSMSRSCPHVWFERSEMKDRHTVANRLRAHVAARTKLPILIFPEGTCVNNTSVMMFKKGSFEIGGTIYPVAIKYDARFGDAFWNSSKYNMVSYLLRIMTSWAIVVNVWYLPPMERQEEEDAAQFANRVKSAIAQQGGLLDLDW
ncbi:hypothetical protein KUCAC02_033759 [Chaenocephalus aceratus]|nr:hypothetical protein KUCAC02_033759 [Chaenocephalus aceratus]